MSDLATRMMEAAENAHFLELSKVENCGKCEGSGHEYIAGEPDWCSVCGGAGYVSASNERSAMRAALIAGLQQHIDDCSSPKSEEEDLPAYVGRMGRAAICKNIITELQSQGDDK